MGVDFETSSLDIDTPSSSVKLNEAVEKLRELGYPLVDTEEGLKAVALKAKSYLSCAIGKLTAD